MLFANTAREHRRSVGLDTAPVYGPWTQVVCTELKSPGWRRPILHRKLPTIITARAMLALQALY